MAGNHLLVSRNTGLQSSAVIYCLGLFRCFSLPREPHASVMFVYRDVVSPESRKNLHFPPQCDNTGAELL